MGTATGVSRHDHPVSKDRSWRLSFLVETEPGRRNRRTVDSVILALAAVLLGLSAAIASSAPHQDHDVAHALRTVFGWAEGFWYTAFVGALVLALVVVVDVLWRRRWDLVRDLVVALVCVAGTAVILGGVVVVRLDADRGACPGALGIPGAAARGARPRFLSWSAPSSSARCACSPSASSRWPRSARSWSTAALPSSVLAALALGVAGGSLVRLVFGTAAGVPPVAQVRAALASLGVQASDLAPLAEQQIGSAEYAGPSRTAARSGCACWAATRRTRSAWRAGGARSPTATRRGASPSGGSSRWSTRRWRR